MSYATALSVIDAPRTKIANILNNARKLMTRTQKSIPFKREEDEAAAAQRGYKGIASASKRRRTTKPAGAPRRVVYVVS